MHDDNNTPQAPRSGSGLSRRDLGVLAAGAAVAVSTTAEGAPLKVMEMDVEVQTPDGLCDAVFVHPTGKTPAGGWPAVLVWTDIMGLRPVFRQMASRMAAEGYAVLVPNPFYRKGRAPMPSGPVNWADPADRAKLMELRSALTPEATARDAIAGFAFLDGQSMVDPGKGAGVQGYCMGGPLSFRTAAAVSGVATASLLVYAQATGPFTVLAAATSAQGLLADLVDRFDEDWFANPRAGAHLASVACGPVAEPGWPSDAEIARLAGSQFDPGAVETFLKIPSSEWVRIRKELEGVEVDEKRRTTGEMPVLSG
jgi:dienelactone hydrolase